MRAVVLISVCGFYIKRLATTVYFDRAMHFAYNCASIARTCMKVNQTVTHNLNLFTEKSTFDCDITSYLSHKESVSISKGHWGQWLKKEDRADKGDERGQ